jgi:hypothetical protein
VIAGVLAHYARRAGQTMQTSSTPASLPVVSYRPETLNILFGEGTA